MPLSKNPRAVLFLVCAAASLLPAQNQGPLSGPVSGVVFDAPSKSLRAIVGVLGSASLGPSLLGDLDAAYVSAAGHAIVFREGACFAVSALLSVEPRRFAIPTCPPDLPDAVSWSQDGATAILRSGNRLQVITGLPGSPSAGQLVNLDTPVLSAIAAGPRGRRILIGVGGERPGVFEVGAGGELTPVLAIERPTLLASTLAGEVVYAWDENSRLLYVQRSDSTLDKYPLSPIEDPVAMQFGVDDRGIRVVSVAGSKDRMLAVFDASTFELLSNRGLNFEPTTIEPLGSGAYLLRSRKSDGEPLWSFVSGTEPRVHFVPAQPAAASTIGIGVPR